MSSFDDQRRLLADFVKRRGLLLMKLDDVDYLALKTGKDEGRRFSGAYRHHHLGNAKRDGLALVEFADDELKIGRISSIQAVSTFDSRIVVDLLSPLAGSTTGHYLDRITKAQLKAPMERLRSDLSEITRITPKLAQAVFSAIAEEPANAETIRALAKALNTPKTYEDARALQSSAIKVALRAFGLDANHQPDALEIFDTETNLAGHRLNEDAVIEHDARSIEGWTLDHSDATGRAIFTRRGTRLEVITANKRPLEKLFGVDLIYLNERRNSLTMVQYKMMERGGKDDRGESDWQVRIDQQFRDELDRMERFDADADPKGCYRLNPGAFFFKFVKRDAALTASSIILSKAHFSDLLGNGVLKGPKGGYSLNYSDLDGHYLREAGLIELIRSGYVGSRGAGTEHLKILIESTLKHGRAAVAAIESAVGVE